MSVVNRYVTDDILIFSSSIEEHRAHLRQVFERLQRNGLIINAAKRLFSQNRLRFLGHIVSDKGIAPVACKVDAINSFSTPQIAQSLRRFLCMVNFYRKFIPQCAKNFGPFKFPPPGDSCRSQCKSFLERGGINCVRGHKSSSE